MTVLKITGIVIVAGMIGLSGLELAGQLSVPGVHSIVTSAEARVGRPLTPVSVAGVGRRTARRCAAGVTC